MRYKSTTTALNRLRMAYNHTPLFAALAYALCVRQRLDVASAWYLDGVEGVLSPKRGLRSHLTCIITYAY